jgi:hypothetical protein
MVISPQLHLQLKVFFYLYGKIKAPLLRQNNGAVPGTLDSAVGRFDLRKPQATR